MFRFLKTTILGGIVFIIPIVVFIVVIGKALLLTNKIAEPLANLLAIEPVGGVAVVNLFALVILILICFLAGLAAKTVSARKFIRSLEANVLNRIPAYILLKAKTQSALTPEEIEDLRPAITRFDDSWQLVFEVERLKDDKVVVFLPGSPDPWTGSICVVSADRVAPLAVTVNTAANLMKRLGRGSRDTLQDTTVFMNF